MTTTMNPFATTTPFAGTTPFHPVSNPSTPFNTAGCTPSTTFNNLQGVPGVSFQGYQTSQVPGCVTSPTGQIVPVSTLVALYGPQVLNLLSQQTGQQWGQPWSQQQFTNLTNPYFNAWNTNPGVSNVWNSQFNPIAGQYTNLVNGQFPGVLNGFNNFSPWAHSFNSQYPTLPPVNLYGTPNGYSPIFQNSVTPQSLYNTNWTSFATPYNAYSPLSTWQNYGINALQNGLQNCGLNCAFQGALPGFGQNVYGQNVPGFQAWTPWNTFAPISSGLNTSCPTPIFSNCYVPSSPLGIAGIVPTIYGNLPITTNPYFNTIPTNVFGGNFFGGFSPIAGVPQVIPGTPVGMSPFAATNPYAYAAQSNATPAHNGFANPFQTPIATPFPVSIDGTERQKTGRGSRETA